MQKTKGGLHAKYMGTGAIAGIHFRAYECGECGILFALTDSYMDNREQDGEGWRCPNGHSWQFTGETREEKLERQLKAERDRSARIAAERDQIEASRRATKGQLTRVKNRIAAGVCPCCGRTFQNLARHMETKHPDYAKKEG